MANLIQRVLLICADAAGEIDGVQHNKCWHGELYDNGDVITRWGRVGYDLQSKTFPSAGESFLLKKKTEKMSGKKGYTEARIVETSGSLASPAAAPVVAKSNLQEIARSQILKTSSPILDKLISRLVASNLHKITSSTNITLNDSTGLFQTPLGIVTPDAIIEARTILADTIPFVKRQNYGEDLKKLVSKYLRLIPQNIGMKFNVAVILPDITAVQKQGDVLDALEASYKAITATKPSIDGKKSVTAEQVFQVDLDIDTGNEASRLEQWFEKSKKTQHGYDRIKIKNVFKVNIHEMDDYFQKNDRKIVETFHGTSEANCLSILKSGLKTSPPSTAAIAGKLWGNGIYGAINSSKSLGYTYGRWGQSSGESGWLFITKFALGNVYYPRGYGGCSIPPSGYNSIWATVANTGLNHDELIVYENSRCNITHLLECK